MDATRSWEIIDPYTPELEVELPILKFGQIHCLKKRGQTESERYEQIVHNNTVEKKMNGK